MKFQQNTVLAALYKRSHTYVMVIRLEYNTTQLLQLNLRMRSSGADLPSLRCQKCPSFSFSHKTPSLSKGMSVRVAIKASSLWLNLIFTASTFLSKIPPSCDNRLLLDTSLPSNDHRSRSLLTCHQANVLLQ